MTVDSLNRNRSSANGTPFTFTVCSHSPPPSSPSSPSTQRRRLVDPAQNFLPFTTHLAHSLHPVPFSRALALRPSSLTQTLTITSLRIRPPLDSLSHVSFCLSCDIRVDPVCLVDVRHSSFPLSSSPSCVPPQSDAATLSFRRSITHYRV